MTPAPTPGPWWPASPWAETPSVSVSSARNCSLWAAMTAAAISAGLRLMTARRTCGRRWQVLTLAGVGHVW